MKKCLLALLCTVFLYNLHAATYYSQTASMNLSTLASWNTNPGGGGASPIAADLTSGTHNFIIQAGHTVTVNQAFTVTDLTVQSTGVLRIGNDGNARTVTINNSLTVDNGGTFSVNSASNSVGHSVIVLNDITNNGTIDLMPDADSGATLNINNAATHDVTGTPTTTRLYRLALGNTAGNIVNLGISIDIDGTGTAMSITANATLNSGSLSHTIVGNWSQAGTHTIGTSTWTFDGAGAGGTITAASFYNVTFATSKSITVGALTVSNDLTVSGTSTTLTHSTFNLTVTRDVIISSSTAGIISGTTGDVSVGRDLSVTGLGSIITTNAAGDYTVTRDFLVSGAGVFGLNTDVAVTGNITVSNNSTLRINTADPGYNNTISAATISVANGSTFDINSAVTRTSALTINDDLLVSGTFDMYSDANSIATVAFASATAHDVNVVTTAPTLVQFYTVAFNANTTTLNYAIDIEAAAGVTGVSIADGATLASGSFTHTNAGFWTQNTTGIHTAGTSTWEFDGAAQTLSTASNFYNVSFTGSNTKTISGALTVSNDMTVGSASVTVSHSTLNIAITRDLVISSSTAGIVTGTTGDVSVGRDISVTGLGSIVNTNTAGDYTVTRDFLVSGAGVFGLNTDVSVTGNITISNNSTLRINTADPGYNNTISAATVSVASGSTFDINSGVNRTSALTINDDLLVSGTFDMYSDANSIATVAFASATAHDVNEVAGAPTLVQFYTVAFNANTTTLNVPIDVEGTIAGSVSIADGATLASGSSTHTNAGFWTQNTTGVHTAGTSTWVFDGAAQTLSTASNFYNVSFTGSNTKTISGALTVSNDMTLGSASVTVSHSTLNIAITRDLVISSSTAGIVTGTTGDVSVGRDISVTGLGSIVNTNTAGDYTVTRDFLVSGAGVFGLNTDVSVTGNITISNNSTLRINTADPGYNNTISAATVSVASGSTFDINSGVNRTSALTINDDLLVSGTFDMYSDANSIATVAFASATAHDVNVVTTAPTLVQFYTVAFNANTTTLNYAIDVEGTGAGSVSIADGATLESGAFTHTNAGFWTQNTTGVHTAGTSTWRFDGAAQTLSTASNFYNVIFEGTNTKTISGTLTIGNDMTVGGTNLSLNSTTFDINVTNDVFNQSATSSSIAASTGTLNVGGDYTANSALAVVNSNIAVTGNMSVTAATTLSIGSAATVRNITVDGDLTVGNGASLVCSNIGITHNLTVNGNITNDGTLDLNLDANDRANLIIGGTGPHTIGGTPTATNLLSLTLNMNSGTTTSNIALDIDGNVTINSGATLDFGTSTHTLAGNLTVTGGTDGVASTLQLDASNVAQNISGAGTIILGNLTFNGGGAAAKLIDASILAEGNLLVTNSTIVNINNTAGQNRLVRVKSDVQVDNGSSLLVGAFNGVHTLDIWGNLTVNGTFDMVRTATTQVCNVQFEDGGTYSISGTPTLIEFNNLTVTGNSSVSLSLNPTVTGNITVDMGSSFDLNGMTLTTAGSITNNGTLEVDANADLLIANGMTLTNGGTFRVVGTAGNTANITRNTAGTYSIVQSSAAATFHALYYDIQYTGGSGITISNGSIDATNNFSEGSFSNGAGTQYLNLTGVNLGAGLTAINTVFGAGPTYNVARTSGTGSFTLEDASGALAGENYDNDNANPGTLVLFSYPSLTFYSQGDGNYSTLTNWTKNANGTGLNPTMGQLTDALTSFIIQDSHDIILDTDVDALAITVGQGASASLTIGNSTTVRNLTVRENLVVNTAATLRPSTNAANHLVNIYGNVTNAGTFDMNNGSGLALVTIYGATTQFFGPNTPTFQRLTLNANSTLTTNVAVDVDENVVINTGATWNDGGLTHTVAGDWTESGTGALAGTGTIQFNSTGVQNIGAAATFNNLEFVGGSPVTVISGALTINGNLLVSGNTTVTSNAVNHTLAGNFSVSSGSFTHTAATFTFNGTNAQSIVGTNATFNIVTFSNGGALAKTVTGTFTATGLVTVSAGATVDGNATQTLSNGITQDGTCNYSGSITFATGGNITTSNASMSLGTADIIVTGNMAIPANKAVSVGGNVSINSGYLVYNSGASLTGAASKTLSVAAGAAMYMRGTNNFPTGFTGGYTLSATSTSHYDLNGPQTVRGNITYGHLTLGGGAGNLKTVDNAIDVNGNVTLNNSIILDLATTTATLAGDITNTGATATIQNGSVTLDNDDLNQTVNNGIYNFTNFTIIQAAPTAARTKTISGNINISGNFSATNPSGGTATLMTVALAANRLIGGNNFTVGDYVMLQTSATTGASSFESGTTGTFSGTKSFGVNSIVDYTRNGDQDIADDFVYGGLRFSNNGNKTALASLDINGRFERTGGNPVFVDGGFAHTVAGDWALGTAYYTSPTSVITLDGAAQDITATRFFDLVVAGTGTKTQIGNITINNDLTINNVAILDADIYDIAIRGDWTCTGTGEFHQIASGTVTFNGTTQNQTISSNAGSYFYNLDIAKTNPAFTTVTLLTSLDVNNRLFLGNDVDATVFDFSNQSIKLGGRFYMYTNSSIVSTGSTIEFDGTGTQFIDVEPSGVAFNNLVFTSGEKRWRTINTNPDVIDVDGNFTINGGAIVDGGTADGYTVNFTIAGDFSNSGTFLHTNRTVTFDGTNQNIGSSTFGSVNFSGSGTKTLGGSVTLNNNLTISDGVTLDVGAGSFSIEVAGNWTNTGTGIFDPRNGTVTFGSGGSNINTGGNGAGKKIYKLKINSAATETLVGNLDVDNDLVVSTGAFTTGANAINIGGSLTNAATFNHSSNASIITLESASHAEVFDPGTSSFRNIVVHAPGTYSLQNNLTINNGQTLTVSMGTFDLNGKQLSMTGAGAATVVTVSGGALEIDADASLLLANSNVVNVTSGIFKLVGTAGHPATIGRNGTTGYTVNISGATVYAQYYQVQNTRTTGISISNSTIDAVNNFSDGTFTGGTGNQYLTLSNDFADFSVSNVQFNSGPTNNVSRPSGAGIITFEDAYGSLAGETNDNDPSNLVNWSFPNGFYWVGLDGTDNTDWNQAANWLGNQVPGLGVDDKVYLNHDYVGGAYTVNIKNANATTYRLTLDAQGGAAINLALSGGFDLDVDENMIINTGTTLSATDNTNAITIGGSWTNNGTFTHNNSTVTFDGTAGPYNITAGTVAGRAFGGLTINGGAAVTWDLGSNIDVDNDLTITSGTLDATTSNYTINVGGNWLNSGSGVFTPRTGTVTFDKSGASTQTISGGPFNIVSLSAASGTAVKQFTSNVTIGSNFTIGANTSVDAGTNTLFIAGNLTNNSSNTAFSQTGTGSVIFNGVNQSINAGAFVTNFNHLTLSGTGTKTFSQAVDITGDVVVGSSVGTVNMSTFQMTGTGTNTYTLAGATTLILSGASNFPSGFETLSLASNSTVRYDANINQTVFATTYGNLDLRRTTGGSTNTKTAAGDLVIVGSLTINDVDTQLNLAVNDADINLTGNLAIATGGPQIAWGATSTLTHVGIVNICGGNRWCIDADITPFHNLVFAGSGTKIMQSNLNVTGNVTVQNGVTLSMQSFTMTGAASKIFALNDGATLSSAIPAATGVAFPTGFTTYTCGPTSTVSLNAGAGVNQTLYSSVTYGNLYISDVAKTVTHDGVSNLVCQGYFYTERAIYVPNAKNITVAGDIWVNNADLSTITLTLNGSANQTIRSFYNGQGGGNPAGTDVNLGSIITSGSGTKTIGDGDDVVIIYGDITIGNGTLLTSARSINWQGATFTNSGATGNFTNTAGTFTFNRATAQSINPGLNNTFNNVAFANTGTVTFNTRGIDVNGTFTIGATSTVDMGTNLTHKFAGAVTNNASLANWITTNAHLTFDGGNQTITPNGTLTARDITISGTGTKTMTSDWSIRALNLTASTLSTTASNYAITLTGNWTNTGGVFTANSSIVTFNGGSTPIDITAGASSFSFVNFAASAINYRLLSATTSITRDMTLGSTATLTVSTGSRLNLGTNVGGGKTYTINGILDVEPNGILSFDNRTSQCTMNVAGTLELVGTNGNVASITRHQVGTVGSETVINITGTIKAQYYLIEYLANSGMNVQASATLDATNNFSDGTWSNMATAAGTRRYLILNCPNPGTSIINVTFNYSAAAVVGTTYNVQRSAGATGNITFDQSLSGVLGDFQYEDDGTAVDAVSGTLRWPGVTQVTWTGAVSRDWNDALNWTPNTIPTSSITANIPLVANNPKITTANADCKNLYMTTGQLTLENGFDLTVAGDVTIGTGVSVAVLAVSSNTSVITVAGGWTRGTNGVFSHGSSTVIFNNTSGTATITPGASAFNNVEFQNSNIDYYLAGATLDIDGSLTIAGSNLSPSTNNYSMTLGGDFNNTGTFVTTTAGTVTLDGAAQSIVGGTFYNLVVSGTLNKVFNTVGSVVNTTTVNSTLEAVGGSIIDFNGNVTFNGGSTFVDGGNAHTFSGANWIGNNTYSGTGSIVFDRNGAQTLRGNFNTVDYNAAGGSLTLSGTTNLTGDFTYQGSGATFNTSTFQMTCTSGTGTFSASAGRAVYIRGANNFPAGFAFYDMNATSNTYYDAAFDQTIRGGVTYGGLIIQNVSTKTLSGDITLNGAFLFNTAGMTFDVSASNYKVTLAGNWNNNIGGIFVPRQGEVVFNGGANQTIAIGALATNNFYNVTVDKTANTVTNNRSFDIDNNLTVLAGSFTPNGNTVTVGGDLLATGGSFVASGTFVMDKSSGTANIQMNGSSVNTLTLAGGAGTTYLAADNLIVLGHFNVNAGTFNGNGKTISVGNGSDNLTIAGTYKVGAGGTLALGQNCNVTVTPAGSLEVIGTSASPAVVSRNLINGAGRYACQINGELAAEYYTFEYMDNGGIYLSTTSTIDATNHLSNGTFTNGPANGPMLRIENTQSFTGVNRIENISFPINPGGTSSNVQKITSVSGAIEIYNATGPFAGETLDDDPSNLITWTGPVTLTWDGSTSSDWFTASNWTPSSGPEMVPTTAENVIIASSSNQPLINAAGAQANNLTINNGTFLTITTGTTDNDLEVDGDISITGTLTLTGSNDGIKVAGAWSKAGTGTVIDNGFIEFDGTGALKTIDNGTASFNNITVSGTSTYQLGANTTIKQNLTITSGTFDVSTNNRTLTVNGNISVSGTGVFSSQSGRVQLSATSGTKTLNLGTSKFYDLDINAPGVTYQITGTTLNVDRTFNILAGTLDLNGATLNFGNGVGTPSLTVAGTLEVDANASLKMAASTSISVASGGTIKVVGTDASNIATVTNQGAGRYNFNVNSGASIEARYYQFANMSAAGINVAAGASLHATNNFSNGTFTSGAAGGKYLNIDCDINGGLGMTLDDVKFNSGPLYNISRNLGTGTITTSNITGGIGYYLYEDDEEATVSALTGLLQWTDNYIQWSGANGTNMNDPLNWLPNVVPDNTYNIVIPDVSGGSNNYPVISSTSGAVTVKNVQVEVGATLTISNNTALNVTGDFNNSGTVTVSTGSTSAITVDGQWSNTGTFNPGSSTVTLTPTTGTFTLTQGASSFNNLTLSGGASFTLSSALDINGNLTLTNSSLDVSTSNYQITLAGNFVNNGTFTARAGTVVLDGTSGTQTITAGTGATKEFYNITKSAGSASNVTVTTDLDVNNNLSIAKGAFNMSNNMMYVGGTFTFNGTSTLTNASLTIDGSSTKTYTNANSSTFTDFTINKSGGASLVLNNSFTVTDDLTLSAGKLSLGTRTLTLSTTADISGGGSGAYIIADGNNRAGGGNVQKCIDNATASNTSFTFPLGDANNYTPFTFTYISGALNSSCISVFVKNTVLPELAAISVDPPTAYINRYWDITPVSFPITGVRYGMTAVYADGDVVGDESLIEPLKRSGSANFQWLSPNAAGYPGSTNTGTNTMTWTNIPSFSFITGSEITSALPISLVSFDAQSVESGVKVQWRTATEINNDFFTIERSKDGVNFEVVAIIDPATGGNSSDILSYSFLDENPYSGVSYYRLSQTDLDGTSETFPMVIVNRIVPKGKEEVLVYPNPVEQTQSITVEMLGFEDESLDVTVYDLMGNAIYHTTVNPLSTPIFKFSTTMSGTVLPEGVYFLNVTTGKRKISKMFTIN